jgi:hypothetical protein
MRPLARTTEAPAPAPPTPAVLKQALRRALYDVNAVDDALAGGRDAALAVADALVARATPPFAAGWDGLVSELARLQRAHGATRLPSWFGDLDVDRRVRALIDIANERSNPQQFSE